MRFFLFKLFYCWAAAPSLLSAPRVVVGHREASSCFIASSSRVAPESNESLLVDSFRHVGISEPAGVLNHFLSKDHQKPQRQQFSAYRLL